MVYSPSIKTMHPSVNIPSPGTCAISPCPPARLDCDGVARVAPQTHGIFHVQHDPPLSVLQAQPSLGIPREHSKQQEQLAGAAKQIPRGCQLEVVGAIVATYCRRREVFVAKDDLEAVSASAEDMLKRAQERCPYLFDDSPPFPQEGRPAGGLAAKSRLELRPAHVSYPFGTPNSSQGRHHQNSTHVVKPPRTASNRTAGISNASTTEK
jgi:hypothetical protein